MQWLHESKAKQIYSSLIDTLLNPADKYHITSNSYYSHEKPFPPSYYTPDIAISVTHMYVHEPSTTFGPHNAARTHRAQQHILFRAIAAPINP